MLKELGFSVADWLKNLRKIVHNQLALTKFGILLGHLEKDVNSTKSVADPGEGPGGPVPPIFRPN